MSDITAEEARELLAYDPTTGVFTRRVQTCNRVKAGELAGSVNGNGYLRIRVKSKQYLAHRLAWLIVTGEFPADQIDHINGVITDNRWCNLRSATRQENDRNRAVRCDSASGCIGVRRHNKADRWVARITVGGRHINLGYFQDLFSAAAARKSAEAIHGYHENSGRRSHG
ncbi:HNH endonuclease signature motif containing protein [Pseudomonas chlororaphis]